MAGPYYVRSTTGNNANTGLSWAQAKATLAGAAAVVAAGETVYVSQAHAETTAASVTLTFNSAGDVDLIAILCANDSAEPPTALATTATMTVTGSSNINIDGAIYVYGMTFISGDVIGSVTFGIATANWQRFEQCSFQMGNTNSSSIIQLGRSALVCPRIEWINCTVKFLHASQHIDSDGAFNFWWNGGGIVAGSTTPAFLFEPDPQFGIKALIENCNFNNFGTAFAFATYLVDNSTFIVRNNELPASWGNNISGYTTHGRNDLYNCRSTTGVFNFFINDFCGNITDSTTVVRTGGITDAAGNLLSLKMAASANVKYPHIVFSSPEFAVNNLVGAVSNTVTVYLIVNSATPFTDAECWLEIQELGNAGSPQGVRVSDQKADFLATAANQTLETTSAWDSQTTARANGAVYVSGDAIKVATNPGRVFFCTTGGTTAGSEPAGYATAIDGGSVTDNSAVFRAGIRQELAVTFTPQLPGSFNMKVKACRQSTTFYYDPKPVVS